MRILFFGTPQSAAEHLKAIASQATHEIAAVITGTDKPRGRGMKVSPTAVKAAAQELGIAPILTPEKLEDSSLLEKIENLGADLGVVVSYGKILPPEMLKSARLGLINVHFSLLPKLRGASPIEHAILEGHAKTGCTILWVAQELDAGDILLQDALEILPQESAPQLKARLVPLGQRLLIESLKLIEEGKAPRMRQDSTLASQAKKIRREDAQVDFEKEDALLIERKVRAFREWPKATAELFGKTMHLLKAQALPERTVKGPYEIEKGRGFVLQCAKGSLLVTEVQVEGKRPTSAWDFIQGLRIN